MQVIRGFQFTKAYRQGEVLFFKVKKGTLRVPAHGGKVIANGVIRVGEKEGHEHKVEANEAASPNELLAEATAEAKATETKPENGKKKNGTQLTMFADSADLSPGDTKEQPSEGVLEVGEGGATVTHPEHKSVKLPKGQYVVKTQKEATGKHTHQSVRD